MTHGNDVIAGVAEEVSLNWVIDAGDVGASTRSLLLHFLINRNHAGLLLDIGVLAVDEDLLSSGFCGRGPGALPETVILGWMAGVLGVDDLVVVGVVADDVVEGLQRLAGLVGLYLVVGHEELLLRLHSDTAEVAGANEADLPELGGSHQRQPAAAELNVQHRVPGQLLAHVPSVVGYDSEDVGLIRVDEDHCWARLRR